MKPKGARELDFSDFYHVHLLQGVLSEKTENQLLDYIIAKQSGIYYIYNKPLNKLPNDFESKEASWYLSAIEILSGYKLAKEKLSFVIRWLEKNKDENGQWDLGTKADCTERITTILQKLNSR